MHERRNKGMQGGGVPEQCFLNVLLTLQFSYCSLFFFKVQGNTGSDQARQADHGTWNRHWEFEERLWTDSWESFQSGAEEFVCAARHCGPSQRGKFAKDCFDFSYSTVFLNIQSCLFYSYWLGQRTKTLTPVMKTWLTSLGIRLLDASRSNCVWFNLLISQSR